MGTHNGRPPARRGKDEVYIGGRDEGEEGKVSIMVKKEKKI